MKNPATKSIALLAVALGIGASSASSTPRVRVHAPFDYAGENSVSAPASKQFDTYAYPIQMCGYDDKGRHCRAQLHKPDHGLLVPGGALLGGDRGEWGGELVFKPVAGPPRTLIDDNILGIFDTRGGVVAFAGLAHGPGHGDIYLVVPAGDGYEAKKFRKLPGAPSEVAQTTDGEVVFRTSEWKAGSSGPSFMCHLLDRDGNLRDLPCDAIDSDAGPELPASNCQRLYLEEATAVANGAANLASMAAMQAIESPTPAQLERARGAQRKWEQEVQAIRTKERLAGCPGQP